MSANREQNEGVAYIVVDMRKRNSIGYGDSTLVFLPEDDIRWLLVDADAKSFQLRFNDSFVSQGFIDVQHDEDEMTCFRDCNNLTASTLTVFSSFNDTRQIEHLYTGSIVLHLARYCSQCREFIRGN